MSTLISSSPLQSTVIAFVVQTSPLSSAPFSLFFPFSLTLFLLMNEVLWMLGNLSLSPLVVFEMLEWKCLPNHPGIQDSLSAAPSLVLLCNHGRVICDITRSVKLDMFAFHIFPRERNQLWQSNDLHIIVLNKKVTTFSPAPESGITEHLIFRSTL